MLNIFHKIVKLKIKLKRLLMKDTVLIVYYKMLTLEIKLKTFV